MKLFVGVIMVLAVLLLFESCKSQSKATNTSPVDANNHSVQGVPHSQNPYPRIPIEAFTGIWKGQENCLPSLITVAIKDSFSVFVSGLYGSDKVTGSLRGYVIDVQPQAVLSSGIKKMVTGRLILSNNHETLRVYLKSGYPVTLDSCIAILNR